MFVFPSKWFFWKRTFSLLEHADDALKCFSWFYLLKNLHKWNLIEFKYLLKWMYTIRSDKQPHLIYKKPNILNAIFQSICPI
jgi:hypothetical protein